MEVGFHEGVIARPGIRCGLCGNEASLKYKDHPGYQEPVRFDIMHCSHCDTSFAFPMEVDNKIYNLIYSNISRVPGYSRYYDYALRVLDQKDPLKHLSLNEDVYWSINNFLQKFSISKKNQILEIGCGFGYLTYAIAKAGYNITGLDISQEAVKNAAKRYGNYYLCADLVDYVQEHKKQFDVVVMTELIEHIPDIKHFISMVDELVKDNGLIVLTTPDKSAFADGVVWKTELPPIHLWWLSKKSIVELAKQIGRKALFTDFSEFNKLNPLNPHRTPIGLPTQKVIFSADDEILVRDLPRKKSWLSRNFKKVRMKLLGNFSKKHTRVDRDILCAVLKKF